MRGLVAYILIVFILFQSAGKTLTDSILCFIHKCEVQEKIRKQALPLCSFSLTEKEYTDNLVEQNELLLNGKMYDIESIVKINGRLMITAYEDNEESSLLAELEKYIGKHASAGKSALKNLKDSNSNYTSFIYIKSFYPSFTSWLTPLKPAEITARGYANAPEQPPSIG